MNKGKAKFSGWHFFLIMSGAFGVVISANLTLAYFAQGSFPGLDVPNPYIASQQFGARRKAQEALGWESRLIVNRNMVTLSLMAKDASPAFPQHVTLRIGSATTSRDDQVIIPRRDDDHFVAPIELEPGNKLIFIDAIAEDGTLFSERHTVVVQ
ncbi:FixH family protein [Alphaproteobacteria bacterium LSUCC0684]